MEGEENLLLSQIHEMSKDILDDLMEIDNKLAVIEEDVKFKDEIKKKDLLESLGTIRTLIGSMEREDIEEMKDEDIVVSINKKLRKLIDMALGD